MNLYWVILFLKSLLVRNHNPFFSLLFSKSKVSVKETTILSNTKIYLLEKWNFPLRGLYQVVSEFSRQFNGVLIDSECSFGCVSLIFEYFLNNFSNADIYCLFVIWNEQEKEFLVVPLPDAVAPELWHTSMFGSFWDRSFTSLFSDIQCFCIFNQIQIISSKIWEKKKILKCLMWF